MQISISRPSNIIQKKELLSKPALLYDCWLVWNKYNKTNDTVSPTHKTSLLSLYIVAGFYQITYQNIESFKTKMCIEYIVYYCRRFIDTYSDSITSTKKMWFAAIKIYNMLI